MACDCQVSSDPPGQGCGVEIPNNRALFGGDLKTLTCARAVRGFRVNGLCAALRRFNLGEFSTYCFPFATARRSGLLPTVATNPDDVLAHRLLETSDAAIG